jgi:hypothetical protein
MLTTNLRQDKLAPCQVDFSSCGMLSGPSSIVDTLSQVLLQNKSGEQAAEDLDCGPVDGYNIPCKVTLAKTRGLLLLANLVLCLYSPSVAPGYSRTFSALAVQIGHPSLPVLVRQFLYTQLHPEFNGSPSDIPLADCPIIWGFISVFHSASSTFFAPSNPSGIGGLYRETIHSTPTWGKGEDATAR